MAGIRVSSRIPAIKPPREQLKVEDLIFPTRKRVYLRISGHHTWMDPFAWILSETAQKTEGLQATGVILFPKKRKTFIFNRSPFIDKRSKEKWEQTTHTRLVVIEGDSERVGRFMRAVYEEITDHTSFYFGRVGIRVQEQLSLPLHYLSDDTFVKHDKL
eukprot:TRINITY_DN3610_c0_g2_i1.p1 TRINITY_DN3610_c0_g2~~TRINITY_DN3610_c0_g2_i1.p1  ORF type:complete len:159 (-),score=29.89 TRINITY_DN3610_c0_g2_i1:166-642(-)